MTDSRTIVLMGIYPSQRMAQKINTYLLQYDEETTIGNVTMISKEVIKQKYTTLAEWPKTTTILCWECGLQINGRPLRIPWPNFNTVDGYVCSGPCGIHHIRKRNINSNERAELVRLFIMAANDLYGRTDIIDIQEAPDKTDMYQYGGKLYNVRTFKQKIKNLELVSNCTYIADTL